MSALLMRTTSLQVIHQIDKRVAVDGRLTVCWAII